MAHADLGDRDCFAIRPKTPGHLHGVTGMRLEIAEILVRDTEHLASADKDELSAALNADERTLVRIEFSCLAEP